MIRMLGLSDYFSPLGYTLASLLWPIGYNAVLPASDSAVQSMLPHQDVEDSGIGEGSEVRGKDGKTVDAEQAHRQSYAR